MRREARRQAVAVGIATLLGMGSALLAPRARADVCTARNPLETLTTTAKGQSRTNNAKVVHEIRGHLIGGAAAWKPNAHRIRVCANSDVTIAITDSTGTATVSGACTSETCVVELGAATAKYKAVSADGRDSDSIALLPYAVRGVASATEVRGDADTIGGLLARGRPGDLLLQNDHIRVIVQAPQRNFSGAVGQFGGQLIDADIQRAPREPGRDLLEEWAFMLNLENTAHYTDVFVLNDGSDGNPAIIRATGVDDLLDRINPSSTIRDFGFPFPADLDDRDLPVEVTTDYSLGPDDDFVRIESTITNVSGSETISTFLGEFLSALGQEIFHPGYGFGEPLVTTEEACAAELPCDFVAYSGEAATGGVSYGYVHTIPGSTSFNTSGVSVILFGVRAVFALIGVEAPNYVLAPGESVVVERFLGVADGDVAGIVDIRNRLKGLPTGTVRGRVTVDGAPLPDAEIAVLAAAAGPGTQWNVASQFRTDADGAYEGTLPAGSYELRVHKDGHLFGSPDPGTVGIAPGLTVTRDFTLEAPGRVRTTIADSSGHPLAAKVSFVGFDPSPDPGNSQSVLGLIQNETGVFGDITKDRRPHGIARVVFVDHSGDSGDVAIEPGDYQVVVSHGTEFSIHVQDVAVTSGGSFPVDADLARVVTSTGFVSADFHVHSFDSPDCAVTREERIVSMLAEGVDFFTPSDHEFRADFTQDLLDLGVEDLISTAVNNEITPFDYGHFGGFPMTVDADQVNGGAVDWGRAAPAGEDFPSFGAYGLSPGEIYDAVRSDPGEDTVQIHHVNSFFDGGLRFDTGVVPPQSNGDPVALRLDPGVANFWDPDFTALEVWEGARRSQAFGNFLGENAGNWFNLLNQGVPRTGYGTSDTHVTVSVQSGGPRSLVASPSDDPGVLGALAETLAMNVNDGRLYGTNAPFLRVRVEGDPGEVGGLETGLPTLVPTLGGSATVTVEIQSPSWAEFDAVEYYVNSDTIADVEGRDGLPPLYRICPEFSQTADTDFTVSSVPVDGGERLEAVTDLTLAGLTEDTWVVVMVKGTDGVSKPLFPVIPNDLDEESNQTLEALKDGNLGQGGVPALAFSNPLFLDVDGNGQYDPPGLRFQADCP
ncbi:MAG: carboxypeptidase regulatory-like domain-containing protein [Deltaproteobacteria bacterium]|nr:MAG: carboxypeptidase regulatory-like domain-containing protein [Deltaproteobacteria bacterium]